MICYRDKTFCDSKSCTNESCGRYLTEFMEEESEKYGIPLCLCSFEPDCKEAVYDGVGEGD